MGQEFAGDVALEAADAPACLRTIKFFDLLRENNDKHWWDLSVRADRAFVYERLLTYGDEAPLMLYLDGSLLIYLWDEPTSPSRCAAWHSVVDATRQAPAQPEHEHDRDEETRRSPVKVVKHADDG